jgi:hypothetical protein
MRTRSILWLVLLATAPLVLAQMSQVTLVLYSGQQHLIRYDYDGSSAARSLANVIGSQVPPGSTFIEFDPVAQAYRPAITRDTEGSWGPRGTTVLQRGTAYWLGIPPVDGIWVLTNSYTVTLTGDVPVSNLTMVCKPLWGAVGYPYPVDRLFTNTQYAKIVANGSQMILWDASSQTFLPPASKTKIAGWTAPASTSVLTAGQGYFLRSASAAATNIVETKPY